MANNDISSKEIKSNNIFRIKILGYVSYIVTKKNKTLGSLISYKKNLIHMTNNIGIRYDNV